LNERPSLKESQAAFPTPKHQNNIATKQTLMVINNANQQDNKDLDKKQMQTINRTT
jgi:hypothetical protein